MTVTGAHATRHRDGQPRAPRGAAGLAVGLTAGLAAALAACLAACSATRLPGTDDPDGGAPDPQVDLAPAVYRDLPAAPILDTTFGPLPADIAGQFGPVTQNGPGAGPCVLEPADGALYPLNWLPLRVSLRPAPGQDVFEVRLRAENQEGELRAYTRGPTFTLPTALWQALTLHSADRPISVSVRGARLSGDRLAAPPTLGFSGAITVAPVRAEGSIVYWTTNSGTALNGFKIGEPTVRRVYGPGDVGTACVGCHSSTPDGAYVAFSASPDPGNGDPAIIDLRLASGGGARPPFLSDPAAQLLRRSFQQLPTFSGAHYTAGDRVMLSMLQLPAGSSTYEIIWTDLEARSAQQGVGWDVLQRQGDPGRSAASATFSHDGRSVLYVSASDSGAGVTVMDGKLYTVPYNDRRGGPAASIAGADDPAWNHYYPTYSPDDAYVAFSRVPARQSSYNNAAAEVLVVPARGGAPARLMANDPPQCAGTRSPGVTNSWPKWSPEVARSGARRYYWLTFSSTRLSPAAGPAVPQLFMAPVVVDERGLRSYPALLLWNQPADQGNHTPAWDVFKLQVG